MLNYTQTFDISEELKLLLSEDNNGYDESEADLTVLGQEKGGAVLFSWVQNMPLTEQLAPQNHTQEQMQVTNIGLYDPYTKAHKGLYTYESKVKLVNATVNEEYTFIGFVVKDSVATTSSSHRLKRQDVYKAFLAEIQPQNRTFSLNLEKPQYIRLQFLYGAYQGHNTREAHLLVMMHKESIGLYHLPIARMGEGVIMSKEPRKEQFFAHKFVWCQWDPTEQRLYIIYHKKDGSKPTLVGYQFSALNSKMAGLMLEQALDFPVPRPSSASTSYPCLAPAQMIQDSSMNLCLLVQNNGTMCVCYQHPQAKTANKTTLEYSVMLIHHGQTINCTASNLCETAVTDRLLFSWLGSHVCVQLAGSFVHFLNVDVDYEPGHHILWHDKTTPDAPVHLGHTGSTMLNLLRDKQQAAGPACMVMEGARGYKMTIDADLLASTFHDNSDSTSRLAILNYALVHNRDIPFMKQLCTTLCEKESSVEMLTYLQEALVGLSYSRARRQVEQADLRRCFPYTTTESLRGQTSKFGNQVLSKLTYSAIKVPLQVGKSPVNRDLWQNLSTRRQQLNSAPVSSPPHRFCTRAIATEAKEAEEKELLISMSTEKPSLLKRLTSRLGNNADSASETASSPSTPPVLPLRGSSRTELGPLPDFLQYTDQPVPCQKQRIELVTIHMCNYVATVSDQRPGKLKLANVASEYLQCQMYASRLLCHILWGIVGDDKKRSFAVLERFLLACMEQGFPWPQPFIPFLSQLAFNTLPLRIFLPYVDQKILHVTPDFVRHVLTTLDDSPQNVSIKQQLLVRLPQDEVLECMKHWSHPYAVRYVARHHTTLIYEKVGEPSSPSLPPPVLLGEQVGHHGNSAPPVHALCSYLKRCSVDADTDLIERAAFLERT